MSEATGAAEVEKKAEEIFARAEEIAESQASASGKASMDGATVSATGVSGPVINKCRPRAEAEEGAEAEEEECDEGVDEEEDGTWIAEENVEPDVTDALDGDVMSLLQVRGTSDGEEGSSVYFCPPGYCVRETGREDEASVECFSADAPAEFATVPVLDEWTGAEGEEHLDEEGKSPAPQCATLLRRAESAEAEQAQAVDELDEQDMKYAMEKMVEDSAGAVLKQLPLSEQNKVAYMDDLLLYTTRAVALLKKHRDARQEAWDRSEGAMEEHKDVIVPILKRRVELFSTKLRALSDSVLPAVTKARDEAKGQAVALEHAKQHLLSTRDLFNSASSTMRKVDELYQAQRRALATRAAELRSHMLLAAEIREQLRAKLRTVHEVLVENYEHAQKDLNEALKEGK